MVETVSLRGNLPSTNTSQEETLESTYAPLPEVRGTNESVMPNVSYFVRAWGRPYRPPATRPASHPTSAGFCTSKGDGWYCQGTTQVQCCWRNGARVTCASHRNSPSCINSGSAGFCAGKGDGWYCQGTTQVQCCWRNGARVTCASHPNSPSCINSGSAGFCAGRADGWYCQGTTRVQCCWRNGARVTCASHRNSASCRR